MTRSIRPLYDGGSLLKKEKTPFHMSQIETTVRWQSVTRRLKQKEKPKSV